MTLDSLLDELMVPQVPAENFSVEPVEGLPSGAGFLGSPGSLGKTPLLQDAIAAAVLGLEITHKDVHAALSFADIEDLSRNAMVADALGVLIRALLQRKEIERGNVPLHYTEAASCSQCGPIWFSWAEEVQECPWCWNRMMGKPIPRPKLVFCAECKYFERNDHPRLGHCAKGEPEALGGLWDTDPRTCYTYTTRLDL